ncbi:unnamed protein product [Pedinophyceae sp. YPF-701]|nr:unnamed protein product [Pedinophyceae sp. YPF-701]
MAGPGEAPQWQRVLSDALDLALVELAADQAGKVREEVSAELNAVVRAANNVFGFKFSGREFDPAAYVRFLAAASACFNLSADDFAGGDVLEIHGYLRSIIGEMTTSFPAAHDALERTHGKDTIDQCLNKCRVARPLLVKTEILEALLPLGLKVPEEVGGADRAAKDALTQLERLETYKQQVAAKAKAGKKSKLAPIVASVETIQKAIVDARRQPSGDRQQESLEKVLHDYVQSEGASIQAGMRAWGWKALQAVMDAFPRQARAPDATPPATEAQVATDAANPTPGAIWLPDAPPARRGAATASPARPASAATAQRGPQSPRPAGGSPQKSPHARAVQAGTADLREWPVDTKWRCHRTVPFGLEQAPADPESCTYWCRVCGRGGLAVAQLTYHVRTAHGDLVRRSRRVVDGESSWDADPRPLYLPLAADPTTRPAGRPRVAASCLHPGSSQAERAAATAAPEGRARVIAQGGGTATPRSGSKGQALAKAARVAGEVAPSGAAARQRPPSTKASPAALQRARVGGSAAALPARRGPAEGGGSVLEKLQLRAPVSAKAAMSGGVAFRGGAPPGASKMTYGEKMRAARRAAGRGSSSSSEDGGGRDDEPQFTPQALVVARRPEAARGAAQGRAPGAGSARATPARDEAGQAMDDFLDAVLASGGPRPARADAAHRTPEGTPQRAREVGSARPTPRSGAARSSPQLQGAGAAAVVGLGGARQALHRTLQGLPDALGEAMMRADAVVGRKDAAVKFGGRAEGRQEARWKTTQEELASPQGRGTGPQRELSLSPPRPVVRRESHRSIAPLRAQPAAGRTPQKGDANKLALSPQGVTKRKASYALGAASPSRPGGPRRMASPSEIHDPGADSSDDERRAPPLKRARTGKTLRGCWTDAECDTLAELVAAWYATERTRRGNTIWKWVLQQGWERGAFAFLQDASNAEVRLKDKYRNMEMHRGVKKLEDFKREARMAQG